MEKEPLKITITIPDDLNNIMVLRFLIEKVCNQSAVEKKIVKKILQQEADLLED